MTTTYFKIMIHEGVPAGSVKVVPRILVAGLDDEELHAAVAGDHKTIYCPNVEAGEKVRAIIAKTEGVEEL